MSRRPVSVQELAREAGIDVDEALVRLWDGGLDHVTDSGSKLFRRDLSAARRAIGIASRRNLSSAEYWKSLFHIDDAEFAAMLEKLSITRRPGTNALPKGAISRLRNEARRLGLVLQVEKLAFCSELPATDVDRLEWRIVGHQRAIRHLSVEDVIRIHEQLADDFAADDDPIIPRGARNEHLLASAAFRVHTSLNEASKYPTPEMASAALFHALVLDHPFHNGNKRTALVSLLVSLDENNLILTCHEDELFRLVLLLAQHKLVDERLGELADRETLHLAEWIRQNSRLIEKGDRPLSWRRLRQILSSHDCEFDFPRGVGNRINVSRRITEWYFWGLARRPRVLQSQVFYGDDGRDAEPNTIAKIRKDLRLDETNGIDSKAFYDSDSQTSVVGDFIVRYRKTLKRLARC
jgi:death-on-curing family protein